jgi:ABC-type transport system involved in multi-copper enzyme maturation permease subunit
MTSNPIIAKELLTVLRSRGAMTLAITYVAALSLLALFMWPASGINPEGANYGRLFFAIILAAQVIMLALFTPPFAATSITFERENNTWEMLHYSLLRSHHILVGKLVGAVAFLLTLVAMSLPVAAVCFILGGVSVREMISAYFILLLAGLSFGLIGVTASAFMRGSFASLIVTYLALLVLAGGVFMPKMLVPEWEGGKHVLHMIECLSPFSALSALTKDAYRTMSPTASAEAVTFYHLATAILCAGLVVALLVRIAMRPRQRIAKRDEVVDKTNTGFISRMVRRVFFLVDTRRRRRPISLWVNPIFVLDIRTRITGLANLIRACFGCFIFSLLLVILVSGTFGNADPDQIRIIALAFQVGLIILIGPSLTIGAIASEKEGRTFDQLRMTPLHSWTIFMGKFGAAAILSLMLVIASAPVYLALLYIEGAFRIDYLYAMLAVSGVTIAFSLSAGFFFSTVCITTARAAAWSYGVMSLATVGTLLAVALRERLSDGAAKVILAFNPFVTMVGAVSDKAFAEFGDWRWCIWALGSLSAIFVVATVYRLIRMTGPTD